MKTPQTIIEKIWNTHVVEQKPGHPAIFAIDLQLVHEVTSSQAFQMLRERNLPVAEPHHTVATLDHGVPTSEDRDTMRDKQAAEQIRTLRQNVKDFGVPIFDFGSGHQGIVHVIGPELGITQPGLTIVCGDSHTSTHGAFGALAFGVGTTEVGLVLATGCLLQSKPKTMEVRFEGEFGPGVFAKDAILKLMALIGVDGATGHVIEYRGSAIEAMTMEERMTICNMSIECGARAGLVSPDETTFAFLKNRAYAPKQKDWDRAVNQWRALRTEHGATFDKSVTIDVSTLEPMITWGTNPGQGMGISESLPKIAELDFRQHINAQKALEYVQLSEGQPIAGTPVDWAFLGSCTNARLADLRVAATILKDHRINPNVQMYVVPGSEAVKLAAEAEGLDQIFRDAGASWRNPGCSACLGLNEDKIPRGARCISSSNRNFIGRQGPGSITHLASPATVAASAVAGCIVSPVSYFS